MLHIEFLVNSFVFLYNSFVNMLSHYVLAPMGEIRYLIENPLNVKSQFPLAASKILSFSTFWQFDRSKNRIRGYFKISFFFYTKWIQPLPFPVYGSEVAQSQTTKTKTPGLLWSLVTFQNMNLANINNMKCFK